jgi:hypothetical protein
VKVKRSVGIGTASAAAFASLAAVAASACSDGSNGSLSLLSPTPPFDQDAALIAFDDASLATANPLSSLFRPSFGPAQTATSQPPALSGGTLLVLADGTHAVAADPDRDALYVVDLSKGSSTTISLQSGDEPGRLVEDGAGRVHVALRRGGALVTVDPSSATVTTRRSACPAPRGLAWDSTADVVWVACATGEILAFPAAGGSATHSYVVERDLRDVVLTGGGLAVTSFRSAEVLRIDGGGSVTRRDSLPAPSANFASHVAWRATAGPSGTIYAVHQEETTTTLMTQLQGGYGSGCFGGGGGPPPLLGSFGSGGLGGGGFFDAGDDAPAVEASAVAEGGSATAQAEGGSATAEAEGGAQLPMLASCTIGAASATTTPTPANDAGSPFPPLASLPPSCETSGAVRSVLTAIDSQGHAFLQEELIGVLPVDLAVNSDASKVAVALPGNAFTNGLPTVIVLTPCAPSVGLAFTLGGSGSGYQPIAVAFDGAGHVLVQTRDPARLWTVDSTGTATSISLSSASTRDTGYDVFHTQAGGMIACASCHPEGRDDGHVWLLDGNKRRTPSLAGTIQGTAPYHWPGDMKDMNALVNDVYTVRMNGATLTTPQMTAVTGWVNGRPAPPVPSWVDTAASARGKALFESAAVGCSGCHLGSKFTDNTTRDVGTGGAFQVPPLVGVGWRTPLMHDGCAATIGDRFGKCSTTKHGTIGALTADNISDLGMYLEGL